MHTILHTVYVMMTIRKNHIVVFILNLVKYSVVEINAPKYVINIILLTTT